MYHIYKITIWSGSERKADIECNIITDNPLQALSELHAQDLGIEMTKYSRLTIKYTDRPDLNVSSYKIGHANKARERKIAYVH